MQLAVHPGETIDFATFRSMPAPAVALDGYVAGPTRVEAPNHATFDHHEGCDRWTTRATCEQVALALRGRCPLLVRDGKTRPELTVHVNDADPDVAVACWLIEHPDAVADPKVNHLVTLEGAIDSVGGSVAFADGTLDSLAWVIDPWAARRDTIAVAGADELAAVIREVGERIDAWLAGRGGAITADSQIELLGSFHGVWVITESHPFARIRAAEGGARAFVAVRPGPRARSASMTVGVCDVYSGTDLTPVWDRLNELESLHPGCDAAGGHWGGSTLIGGSPRGAGTTLDAATVAEVVASAVA